MLTYAIVHVDIPALSSAADSGFGICESLNHRTPIRYSTQIEGNPVWAKQSDWHGKGTRGRKILFKARVEECDNQTVGIQFMGNGSTNQGGTGGE